MFGGLLFSVSDLYSASLYVSPEPCTRPASHSFGSTVGAFSTDSALKSICSSPQALLLALSQILASYAVLKISHGQPVTDWQFKPSVYLGKGPKVFDINAVLTRSECPSYSDCLFEWCNLVCFERRSHRFVLVRSLARYHTSRIASMLGLW